MASPTMAESKVETQDLIKQSSKMESKWEPPPQKKDDDLSYLDLFLQIKAMLF